MIPPPSRHLRNNRQAAVFAEDLEAFAKHGRRKKVGTEDVLLLARRSKPLVDHLRVFATTAAAAAADDKKKKSIKDCSSSNNNGGESVVLL